MMKKYFYSTLTLVAILSCQYVCGQKKQFFQSFDNIPIAFEDIGDGEPVLLIHGFISSGSSWGNSVLKKQLIDEGFRVIIPDLMGNGDSGKPQHPESYANDAEIKDLVALANHLKLSQYKAIGYSRGSIILAKLLTQESRITRAVLGGMGIDFTNPDWDRRIMFAKAFAGTAPLNEVTEGAVNYSSSIGADLKVLSYLQQFQPVTLIEELEKIQTPLLVIAGSEDKDNGEPKYLHQALPNSQLVLVPGDHNNTYKTEVFSQKVLAYLKQDL